MEARVELSKEDGVAAVTLNRPEKRNGLDLTMFEELIAAGAKLAGDRSVRAVVLCGEGKAFCAGLDFAWFVQSPESAQRLLKREEGLDANVAQRVAMAWQEVACPVIAAVHGACFGGGLQIALGADIRYASPDAQLSVMEIKWGIIPDMGITQTLFELVRADRAKELCFTGRIVGANEALDLGLVTRVCEDPRAEALTLAKTIASKSPDAIRATKALFRGAKNLSVKDALLLETELQLPLLGSPNQLEAVQANFQKRTPVFEDPRS